MDHKIRNLLNQISALEDELRTALYEQEDRLLYKIHAKRIHFEDKVRKAHPKLKRSVLRWISGLVC